MTKIDQIEENAIFVRTQLYIAQGFPLEGTDFIVDDSEKRIICESRISGGNLCTVFDLRGFERKVIGVKTSFNADAPEYWEKGYHTNFLRYRVRYPEDCERFHFEYDEKTGVFSLYRTENLETFYAIESIRRLILEMVEIINRFRSENIPPEGYDCDETEDDECNYGDER